ncbi:MAG: ATP-binding protein [Pseudomonadota bacterium]
MSERTPTLHMVCGKIASGKSTLAANIGRESAAIVISEDTWLNALFAEDLQTISDYVRCTKKLREAMAPHVTSLLHLGVSVVLDFQANTVEARKWMSGIIEASGASHVLHVLDVPDAVCLERLKIRNARGDHPFLVTEEQYHQISNHFSTPSSEENFNIVVHPSSEI